MEWRVLVLGIVLTQAVFVKPRHSLRFLQQEFGSDNAALQEANQTNSNNLSVILDSAEDVDEADQQNITVQDIPESSASALSQSLASTTIIVPGETSDANFAVNQGPSNSTEIEDEVPSNSTEIEEVPPATELDTDEVPSNSTEVEEVPPATELDTDEVPSNSTEVEEVPPATELDTDEVPSNSTEVEEVPPATELDTDEVPSNSTEVEEVPPATELDTDEVPSNSTEVEEVPPATELDTDEVPSNSTEIMPSQQSPLVETNSGASPREVDNASEVNVVDQIEAQTRDSEASTVLETAEESSEASSIPTSTSQSDSQELPANTQNSEVSSQQDSLANGNAQFTSTAPAPEAEEEAELEPNQFRVTLIPASDLFDPPASINLATSPYS
jgi:hypothetical protein